MRRRILIDTGPLVASINRRDKFHVWARERFGEISPPVLTCEAVLAEACFLLQETSGGSAAVLELVDRGVLLVAAAALAASLSTSGRSSSIFNLAIEAFFELGSSSTT